MTRSGDDDIVLSRRDSHFGKEIQALLPPESPMEGSVAFVQQQTQKFLMSACAGPATTCGCEQAYCCTLLSRCKVRFTRRFFLVQKSTTWVTFLCSWKFIKQPCADQLNKGRFVAEGNSKFLSRLKKVHGRHIATIATAVAAGDKGSDGQQFKR